MEKMELTGNLAAVAAVAAVLADPEVTPPATRRCPVAEVPVHRAYEVEVATMTTTNAAAVPVATANLYPFQTQRQVRERLEQDPIFRVEAVLVLFRLQTEAEQAKEDTEVKNRQGFMSSHAANGSRVAKKVLIGLAGQQATTANLAFLSPEDWKHIDAIAPHYSRQLAKVARARAIAEDPALKAVAAMFSAD